MAVREAISLLRKQGRHVAAYDDELERLPEPGYDPELHYMKAQYREAFRTAFESAVDALSGRERNDAWAIWSTQQRWTDIWVPADRTRTSGKRTKIRERDSSSDQRMANSEVCFGRRAAFHPTRD